MNQEQFGQFWEQLRTPLNAKWEKGGTEEIWPVVLAKFHSIKGYEVRWSLVRASDYGVPQNRPNLLARKRRPRAHARCERGHVEADDSRTGP